MQTEKKKYHVKTEIYRTGECQSICCRFDKTQLQGGMVVTCDALILKYSAVYGKASFEKVVGKS